MSIDWNKPLRTKEDKFPARFVSEIKSNDYPMAVVITPSVGSEYIETYTRDGRTYSNGTSVTDLENIPEDRIYNLHVYEDTVGDLLRYVAIKSSTAKYLHTLVINVDTGEVKKVYLG